LYEYKINKILKIYDGDTITVEIDLGFGVAKKEKLRFDLINAPEIRGDSRIEGLKSRDWLRMKLYQAEQLNKDIIIKTKKDKKGKYGRYIAEIFIDNISVNRELVHEGLAVFKEY
jgi:micrococcal nuclease